MSCFGVQGDGYGVCCYERMKMMYQWCYGFIFLFVDCCLFVCQEVVDMGQVGICGYGFFGGYIGGFVFQGCCVFVDGCFLWGGFD